MFHSKQKMFVLLLLLALFSLTLSVTAQRAEEYPTDTAPPDYKPIPVRPNQERATADVALLIDVQPWGSTAIQNILNGWSIPFDVYNSTAFPVNLSPYKLVIVAEDQTDDFYHRLGDHESMLEVYLKENCGVLEVHGSGWGWNGGNASQFHLPGGVDLVGAQYEWDNATVAAHPAMAGIANPFSGTYASHGIYSNLIAGTNTHVVAGNVIDPNEPPTFIEYSYGNGLVIGTMQTHSYAYHYNQAGKNILPQLLDYAYSKAESCEPDLAIKKSAEPNHFTVNQPAQYELFVENVGSGSAIGPITVNDTLPTGITPVNATTGVSPVPAGWSCTYTAPTITCTHPSPLSAGYTATFPIPINVANAAMPFVKNCATVKSSNDVDDQNNSSCVETDVIESQIPIEWCATGWDIIFAPNGAYLDIHMRIYNDTATTQSYNLAFVMGAGMTGTPTGSIIIPAGAPPVAVPSMSSQFVKYRLTPPPTIVTSPANYEFAVTNLNTGDQFDCGGHVWKDVGGVWVETVPGDPILANPNQAVQVEFVIHNDGNAAVDVAIDFEGMAMVNGMEQPVMQLNNPNPTGSITILPGDDASATVDVTIDDVGAEVFGDVMGIFHLNGNADPDLIASAIVYTEIDNTVGELYIDPGTTTLPLGDTTDIAVAFDAGATGVQGLDLDLQFDPAIVTVIDVVAGNCFDFTIEDSFDNAAGTIEFAAAMTGVACTDGEAAIITVEGAATGNSFVSFTNWAISDSLGDPIILGATAGAVNVISEGEVSGTVELQSRTDHSGATVTLWDGATAIATATTNAAGEYSLNVAPGTYEISVEMDSYLDGRKSGINVTIGNTTTVNSVQLLGGDVNASDCINIFDIAAIAGSFGNSVPPAPVNLDINGDGTINILDIAVSAGNYPQCEPIPWP